MDSEDLEFTNSEDGDDGSFWSESESDN